MLCCFYQVYDAWLPYVFLIAEPIHVSIFYMLM